jgi:hypothetical protein
VVEDATDILEDVGYVSALGHQLGTRGDDVWHVQASNGSWGTVRDTGPEGDRRRRSRWCELDDAEVLARGVVEVLPKPDRLIEGLCAIYVEDGQHHPSFMSTSRTPANGNASRPARETCRFASASPLTQQIHDLTQEIDWRAVEPASAAATPKAA